MGYRRIIFIGFLMVLLGFIVPFLMVIQVIGASFWLSFVSYALSIGGLFLGIIGASQYTHVQRRNDPDEENPYNFKR